MAILIFHHLCCVNEDLLLPFQVVVIRMANS